VLTLQGQAGNVSLTSGGGIAVNGTTLANTGVLSVGGQTGNIPLGSGLAVSGGQLKNSGIVSAALVVVSPLPMMVAVILQLARCKRWWHGQQPGGTAGKLAVFTGVQTLPMLLSEAAGTVPWTGNGRYRRSDARHATGCDERWRRDDVMSLTHLGAPGHVSSPTLHRPVPPLARTPVACQRQTAGNVQVAVTSQCRRFRLRAIGNRLHTVTRPLAKPCQPGLADRATTACNVANCNITLPSFG